MAVVEWALWGIDGQHLVVGANAVPLRVRIRQRARLKHLVVAEPDACAATRRKLGMPFTLPLHTSKSVTKFILTEHSYCSIVTLLSWALVPG